MFDDKFDASLSQGHSLLESGEDLKKAQKHFLVARSFASTNVQRFKAMFGHLRVLAALGKHREVLDLVPQVEELADEASAEEAKHLAELKTTSTIHVDHQLALTAAEQDLNQAAIDAAGGVTPASPNFVTTMQARANSGVIAGGWPAVQSLFSTIYKAKTALHFAQTAHPEQSTVALSKFGGVPYSQAAKHVPNCDLCQEVMQFCVQLDCAEGLHELHPGIGLTVLFICPTHCLSSLKPEHGTWEVRNYPGASTDKFVALELMHLSHESGVPYSSHLDEKILLPGNTAKTSAPSFALLQQEAPAVLQTVTALYPPDPKKCYDRLSLALNDKLVDDAIGSDFTIGGYPYFYNGEFVEHDSEGHAMTCLWTVASVDGYFNFGDDGYLSLYYSPVTLQYKLRVETT